ncbi:MAG: YihY/virulence factor BrkB family protein [Propionibacteriaceae bacterium]|jgi:membrane protein|nr:YihY/virulence factor BrkB family protein [Propionibacteriaceae bacterium]
MGVKWGERARLLMRSVWFSVGRDSLSDQAGALTYYMILSAFPLLLAVVSLLSLLGVADTLVPALEQLLDSVVSQEVAQFLAGLVRGFLTGTGATWTLLLAVLVAIWSASKYVAAFGRAMNTVFGVVEGRPFLKLKAMQLLLTASMIVAIVMALAAMILSDPVTQWLDETLHIGSTLTKTWLALRTPLAISLVSAVLAALYYITPNVRRRRRALLSVGAVVAILAVIVVFWGFGLYLNVFDGTSNYTKTYGALAGGVLALFSMWLINFVALIGAEVDAQLERLRELANGLPAERQLLLPVRDDRGQIRREQRQESLAEAAAELRQRYLADGAKPDAWYQRYCCEALAESAPDADISET